jgi:HK97 family phage major capsid protein/HK97 family phage prohead protease
MEKTIRPGTRVTRALACERAIDDAARTVSLAFSSETPYERYWGIEILDHAKSSVRMDRLKAGAPLLIDHDNSIRSQVGIIESVEIDADRIGRAVVRFGSDADSDLVFQKVKDGIVKNVSVGYVIHKAQLVETKENTETYRVTDWEPLEISLVAVPADHSVGVGRSIDGGDNVIQILKETSMSEITVDQVRADAAAESNKRIADIIALGELHARHGGEKLAADALRSGKSVDEFRALLLDKVASAPAPTADIGMTQAEAKQFSFMRAINALANPGDRKAQEAARFEREASDAFAAKFGKSAQGFFVPVEVQKRDLVVGTPGSGGYTVATNLLAQSFIDLLRNRMMVMRMGAQMLTGLVGNIAIPRQTGGATSYWVAESGAPTESGQTFDQVAMSPKTVGAYTDISRKLLLQSSIDVESFVRNDLATVLALAIDSAAISGTGLSNQPTGILATSGIGDVAGGTDGAAPTFAHIVGLWSDIAGANADFGNTGVLTNSAVIGKLMTTLKTSGVAGYVVEGFPSADGMTSVAGLRGGVSNQVPSNLTKGTSSGVCSAIIAGNWNDLIIGQWGSLDLMVDPYTGSTSGTVRVVALQDVDIAVRHAVSFSAMKDALTA